MVNFLLFMRETLAEMVEGHYGRNPSPHNGYSAVASALPGDDSGDMPKFESPRLARDGTYIERGGVFSR